MGRITQDEHCPAHPRLLYTSSKQLYFLYSWLVWLLYKLFLPISTYMCMESHFDSAYRLLTWWLWKKTGPLPHVMKHFFQKIYDSLRKYEKHLLELQSKCHPLLDALVRADGKVTNFYLILKFVFSPCINSLLLLICFITNTLYSGLQDCQIGSYCLNRSPF